MTKKNRKEGILCEQKRVNKSGLLYDATTQKRFFRFKCLETLRVALTEEENKGLPRFEVIR